MKKKTKPENNRRSYRSCVFAETSFTYRFTVNVFSHSNTNTSFEETVEWLK